MRELIFFVTGFQNVLLFFNNSLWIFLPFNRQESDLEKIF